MFNKQKIEWQIDVLLTQVKKSEEILTGEQLERVRELKTLITQNNRPFVETSDLWHKLCLLDGFQLRLTRNVDLKQIEEKLQGLLCKVNQKKALSNKESKELEELGLILMTFDQETSDEYERICKIEAKIKDESRRNELHKALKSVLP